MKAILTALLLLVSVAAGAKEDFEFTFINGTHIENNEKDWALVSEESKVYNLYTSHDAIGTGNDQVQVHTKVEYLAKDGFRFDALSEPVKRIFSFGVVDCEQAIFYLLADFFVDSSDKILFRQDHEPGEYRVEMLTPNTARNSLFKLVCAK
jgi:hypothetical protein